MVKAVVTREEFGGLPEAQSSLYRESGDNYVLDIEGVESHPSVAALKTNSDAILEEKRRLKSDMEAQVDQLRGEIDAHDKGKREEAEKKGQYRELYEAEQKKRTEETSLLQNRYDSAMRQVDEKEVQSAASDLAHKLGGSDYAMGLMPHISPRLKVVDIDGKRELRVVDITGAISSHTMEDLVNELKGRSDLKPLIRGPGSTGGGAPPAGSNSGGNSSGGAPLGDWDQYFKQGDTWNLTKQGELFRTDREQYEKLKAKYA
jgi:hypothetical protein